MTTLDISKISYAEIHAAREIQVQLEQSYGYVPIILTQPLDYRTITLSCADLSTDIQIDPSSPERFGRNRVTIGFNGLICEMLRKCKVCFESRGVISFIHTSYNGVRATPLHITPIGHAMRIACVRPNNAEYDKLSIQIRRNTEKLLQLLTHCNTPYRIVGE